jgi:hypothetical protein
MDVHFKATYLVEIFFKRQTTLGWRIETQIFELAERVSLVPLAVLGDP